MVLHVFLKGLLVLVEVEIDAIDLFVEGCGLLREDASLAHSYLVPMRTRHQFYLTLISLSLLGIQTQLVLKARL